MQNYIKQLSTLPNGSTISVFNMNLNAPVLRDSIALSGLPETRVSKNGRVEYAFSNPETGWFTTISETDVNRMANVSQLDNGMLIIAVTPFVTYTLKDYKNAKPFVK